jgi:hypothetical protein
VAGLPTEPPGLTEGLVSVRIMRPTDSAIDDEDCLEETDIGMIEVTGDLNPHAPSGVGQERDRV